MRKGRSVLGGVTFSAAARSASRNWGIPSPVVLDTGNTGLLASSVTRQQFAHFLGDQFDQIGFHQVALGDGYDCRGDAQQVYDLHVFDGLGHDRIVGGHHDQGHVDPGGARDHGADEAFVPGHVHDAEGDPVERQFLQNQFDGHPAALLFRQAIGVHTGQRPHQ
jgi:hypothetical protein